MNTLTMNERTIIALFAAPTRAVTVERMGAAPIEEAEGTIRAEFFSALKKLMAMSEEEYLALDLRDVLVADEEDTGDGDE